LFLVLVHLKLKYFLNQFCFPNHLNYYSSCDSYLLMQEHH